MGSPVSLAIADLFMSKLEENVWYRHVGDVFSIVEKKLVQQRLAHMNCQHSSITFTLEEEIDGKLPFMDVRIHQVDGPFKTNVDRKPTHWPLSGFLIQPPKMP